MTPPAPSIVTELGIGLRLTLRYWKHHWVQSVLLVLVMGLGVGSFLSIRVANRAAAASFGHFTDTLTGEADWVIQPSAGTLPDAVLSELRTHFGARPVHLIPVLEGSAVLEAESGKRRALTLLGVDLAAISNLGDGGGGWRPSRETHPAGAGVSAWAAAGTGLREGQTVYLIFGDRRLEVFVSGVVPEPEGAPRLGSDVFVFDLPVLQEASYRTGQLDRIEFRCEAGPDAPTRREEVRAILEESSRGRWTVVSPRTRRETGDVMTRAFQLNLSVLSLIALLVGLYLIYQAMDGAVVRRQQEMAILKSLGFTETALLRLWVLESAAMGVAGGVVGIGFGVVAARASVEAVGQTVNALYFASTVGAARLGWSEAVLALAVGVAASVVAGWIPARRASRIQTARLLVRHETLPEVTHPRRWLAAGWALLGAGLALSRFPGMSIEGGGRFPLAGYGAAFAWIVGAGLVSGSLLSWFGGRLRRFLSAPGRIAGSYLVIPSTRHRLAVSALVCAVGMTAAMAILVASFDTSVRSWIEQSLSSDLYIAASGRMGAGPSNRMSEATWKSIAGRQEVAQALPLSLHSIEVNGLPTQLAGADLAGRRGSFVWVERPTTGSVFEAGSLVCEGLATESFCERYHVTLGSVVSVPTPSGAKAVTIAGITADYGSERGSLTVDLRWTREWFSEETVTHLALTLKPGVDARAVLQTLKQTYPSLVYYENAALRAEILRIFRQTFGITYALEVLGLVVALAGLAMTMASLLLERRAVLTTVRALGFSRGEIAASTGWEGGAVSTVAALGGLGLSVALGWLLVFVINKQSFGWTLQFTVPWGALAVLGAAVVATGGIVSLALGRWGAELPADREE